MNMKEINKDFYCSAGLYMGDKDCLINDGTGYKECVHFNNIQTCRNYHRKHPTPEQFEKEYGFKYSDDGAVWIIYDTDDPDWELMTLEKARDIVNCSSTAIVIGEIICACTPWGKPDKDRGSV